MCMQIVKKGILISPYLTSSFSLPLPLSQARFSVTVLLLESNIRFLFGLCRSAILPSGLTPRPFVGCLRRRKSGGTAFRFWRFRRTEIGRRGSSSPSSDSAEQSSPSSPRTSITKTMTPTTTTMTRKIITRARPTSLSSITVATLPKRILADLGSYMDQPTYDIGRSIKSALENATS